MRLWAALSAGETTSDLYTVDPLTGAMTSVGPIGDAVTGLAMDPTTGILYGATGNQSIANPNALITIDLTTGAGTLIGALVSAAAPITDICFDSTGQMYGFAQSRRLVSIDKATAVVAIIGSGGGSGTKGGALSIASDGTFYLLNRTGSTNTLYTVDPGTGAETIVATGTVKCNSAAFDASDVLYAVKVPDSFGAIPATLVTIDLVTGAATTIGVMTDNTDALAWEVSVTPPPPPSPQPNFEWRFAVTKLNLRVLSWLDRVATQRKVTYTLNKPAIATGVVPSDSPTVNLVQSDGFRILDEGVRCLIGFRRESGDAPKWIVRFAGIVELLEDNVDENGGVAPYSTYTAYDPRQLLYARPVRKADGSLPGRDGVSFTGARGNAIVEALLERTFAQDGQHYIVTPITAESTDIISKITFQQGTSVGQALDQLTATRNCDIIFNALYDPVGNPNKLATVQVFKLAGYSSDVAQVKHKAPLSWDKPRRNLVALNRLKDGTQRANRIQFFTGAGGASVGVESDFASAVQYGDYWAEQFFSGASKAAVELLAAEQIILRSKGVKTYKANPVPGSLGQINSPLLFLDYTLGTVLPIFASGRFRKKIAVGKRVISIPVVIRDDGVETIEELEFGEGEVEVS